MNVLGPFETLNHPKDAIRGSDTLVAGKEYWVVKSGSGYSIQFTFRGMAEGRYGGLIIDGEDLYAADCGLEPYDNNQWNTVNFTLDREPTSEEMRRNYEEWQKEVAKQESPLYKEVYDGRKVRRALEN